jgi:hypothetical protein
MTAPPEDRPPCFGALEIVFPQHEDGLRTSPESCLACGHKTACLRLAMTGKDGLRFREQYLDKAYEAGMVGFLERWSKKKEIRRRIRQKERGDHENH